MKYLETQINESPNDEYYYILLRYKNRANGEPILMEILKVRNEDQLTQWIENDKLTFIEFTENGFPTFEKLVD